MSAVALPAPPVICVRCRVCGKWRNPHEFIHDHVVGYCWHCYERHCQALAVLGGQQPKGCLECGRSVAELCEAAGGGDLRMELHVCDGILALFCKPCGVAYALKRADMYGATGYGRQIGL